MELSMPVIVFASSKGGAGKTTACVVLASELARQGMSKDIRVAIVDADPNQHSAAWAKLDGRPSNIDLFENVTEDSILDMIEKAKDSAGFVLVDLEGVSSNSVTFATSQADLVIIPCQPSQNDAKEAVKTIKMVKNSSKMIRRDIPLTILFTRVSAALVTKTGRYLVDEFEKSGIDVFKTSLIDREAFKSIFSYGGTVNNLDAKDKKAIASLDKTASNVNAFAHEVKLRLKKSLSSMKREA